MNRAFERVLATLRDEQHHDRRSHYRHPDLANGGKGSWVRYTGMIWTGFRPSDDPARYQYNIPDNMFAVVVLRRLAAIERDVYHNNRDASNAWGLSVEIQAGIEQYAKASLPGFGRIYAYEVDGYGHANLMDDANIPSLLSIPYFGYLGRGQSDVSEHAPFRAFTAQPVFLYRQIRARYRKSAYAARLYLAAVARRAGVDDEGPVRNRSGHGVHCGVGRRRPSPARIVQR